MPVTGGKKNMFCYKNEVIILTQCVCSRLLCQLHRNIDEFFYLKHFLLGNSEFSQTLLKCY